jgi:hypothetical protein
MSGIGAWSSDTPWALEGHLQTRNRLQLSTSLLGQYLSATSKSNFVQSSGCSTYPLYRADRELALLFQGLPNLLCEMERSL